MRYLVPNPRQKVADTEFVRSLEHKKVSFKWTRRSLGCSESCGGGTCFAILCSEISVWVGFLFHNILRPYFIEAMPTPSKQRPTSLFVSERAKERVSARALKLASHLRVTVKKYLHHDLCVFQRKKQDAECFCLFISYRCRVDQKCVCPCWWRIPGQRPLLRRKEAWWWDYQMQHLRMPSQVRMLVC